MITRNTVRRMLQVALDVLDAEEPINSRGPDRISPDETPPPSVLSEAPRKRIRKTKPSETPLDYATDIRPKLFDLLTANRQNDVQRILNDVGVSSGVELAKHPELFSKTLALVTEALHV